MSSPSVVARSPKTRPIMMMLVCPLARKAHSSTAPPPVIGVHLDNDDMLDYSSGDCWESALLAANAGARPATSAHPRLPHRPSPFAATLLVPPLS